MSFTVGGGLHPTPQPPGRYVPGGIAWRVCHHMAQKYPLQRIIYVSKSTDLIILEWIIIHLEFINKPNWQNCAFTSLNLELNTYYCFMTYFYTIPMHSQAITHIETCLRYYFPNYVYPNPPCQISLWEETGAPAAERIIDRHKSVARTEPRPPSLELKDACCDDCATDIYLGLWFRTNYNRSTNSHSEYKAMTNFVIQHYMALFP